MLSSVPSNYCRGILSRMGECLGLFFSALNFLEVYRNQSQGNGLGTPAGATTCWAWPGSEFSDLGIYRVGIFRPKIQKKSFYELERCRNAQNEKITCTEGYMLASFGDWWVERRQIGSENSDLGRSENSDLIFLAQSIPKRSKRKKTCPKGYMLHGFEDWWIQSCHSGRKIPTSPTQRSENSDPRVRVKFCFHSWSRRQMLLKKVQTTSFYRLSVRAIETIDCINDTVEHYRCMLYYL